MKTANRIFTQGCVISVVITVVFCLFIKISNTLTEAAMTLTQYLIILLFSFLAAAANQIFRVPFLPRIAQLIIHCVALCLDFCAVFICFNKINITSPSVVFIVVFAFILLYALVTGIVFLVRHFLCPPPKNPEKPYTPLYK